jgi:hypothetical protein
MDHYHLRSVERKLPDASASELDECWKELKAIYDGNEDVPPGSEVRTRCVSLLRQLAEKNQIMKQHVETLIGRLALDPAPLERFRELYQRKPPGWAREYVNLAAQIKRDYPDEWEEEYEERVREANNHIDDSLPPAVGDSENQRIREQISYLLNASISVIRRGNYGEALRIAEQARQSYQKLTPPDPRLYEELIKAIDRAQYEVDKQQRLDQADEYVMSGNWMGARDSLRKASEDFRDEKVFAERIQKIQNALDDETALSNRLNALDIQGLGGGLVADGTGQGQNLLQLRNELLALPGSLGTGVQPTAAQRAMRKRILDIAARLEQDARNDFNHARALPLVRYKEKDRLLKSADEKARFVKRLREALEG